MDDYDGRAMVDTIRVGGLFDSPESIVIQTRKGSNVDNWFSDEPLPYHQVKIAEQVVKRFARIGCRVRSNILTSRYNCHGLTFANRRTGLVENHAIDQILREDGYRPIQQTELVPGDVILYKDRGAYSHSAVVIEIREVSGIRHPILLSKWGAGAEWIHSFGVPHPYSDHIAEFWTDRPK